VQLPRGLLALIAVLLQNGEVSWKSGIRWSARLLLAGTVAALFFASGNESASAEGPGACSAGQPANVVGTVLDQFGNPFPTIVELRFSEYGDESGFIWAEQDRGFSTSTDATGRYRFCVDFESLAPDAYNRAARFVQAIARTTPTHELDYGNTPSSRIPSGECLEGPCLLDITMQSPEVRGVVIGAKSVEIVYGQYNFLLAEVQVSGDGRFSYSISDPRSLPQGAIGQNLRLTIFPSNPAKVPVVLTRQITGSPIVITESIDFQDANFVLNLSDSQGRPLVNAAGVNLNRRATPGCSPQNPLDDQYLSATGCTQGIFPSGLGRYVARISDGAWQVTAWAPGLPFDWGQFTYSGNGTDREVDHGPLTVVGSDFHFQLSKGRIQFDIADHLGAQIDIQDPWLVGSDPGSPVSYVSLANIGPGLIGWNPTGDGEYRLRLTRGLITTWFGFEVEGALTSPRIVKTCRLSGDVDPSIGDCDLDPPEPTARGAYPVVLDKGDLSFIVCGEVTNGLNCPSPGSSVRVVVTHLTEGGANWGDYADSQVPIALGSSDEVGHYRVSFVPPDAAARDLALATVNLYVRRNANGSIDRCGTVTAASQCLDPVPLVVSDGVFQWPEEIRLRSAPLVVAVKKPAPCSVDCNFQYNTDIIVSRIGGWGQEQFETLRNWKANPYGFFGFDFEPGFYRLVTDTYGSAVNLGLVEGVVEIQVGFDGRVIGVDGDAVDPTGDLTLFLRDPNVAGLVRMGGAPASSWVSVEFEKRHGSTGQFEYTGQMQDVWSGGRFGLILSDGVWRVNAYPRFDEGTGSLLLLPASEVFEVVGGQVSRIGACVLDVNQPCEPLTEGLVVDLVEPNLTGTFARVDAVTGQLVLVDGNLDITRRDASGAYQTDPQPVRSEGNRFSARLSPGMYKVRFGVSLFAATNLPQTTKFLLVGESGACLVASDTATTCAQYGSTVTLVFDPPNFSGRVRGNNEMWPAFINFTPYVQYFGFADISGLRKTTTNFNAEGRFGVKLDDGYYRVEVDPSPWRPHTFGKAVRVVRVAGSQWCVASVVAGVPQTCSDWQSGEFVVDLPSSNFDVQVKYNNGSSLVVVPWGKVDVYRLDSPSQWRFVQSTGFSNGRFSLRLDDTLYGSDPIVRYELVVRPNGAPASVGLVPQRIALWLGDFDSGGQRDDVCTVEPVDGACAAISRSLEQIVMVGGNFRARVVHPVSRLGVNGGWVNVWGFSLGCWTQPESCQRFAHVDSSGVISFDLPTGYWKIAASPPWGSNSLVGRQVNIVVVNANKWCLASDHESLGTNCVQPVDFEIEMRVPNVSAQIVRNGSPVSGFSVGFQKKQTDGVTTWWSYAEGTGLGNSGGSNGHFAEFLVDGDYRLVVSPPYENPMEFARFSREFSVVNGVDDLPSQIAAPTGNLSFRLVDSGGQAIESAWLYLEKWVVDGWRWADNYARSSSNGSVALQLIESGRYRMTLYAPGDLPRFSREFEVIIDGQGGLSFSSGLIGTELVVPAPNARGVVTVDGVTANEGGLVQVLQGGVEVESTNSRADGSFNLRLADGSYTIRFHPNYSGEVWQPIEVIVVIQNGELTTWRYASQQVGTNNCQSPSCQLSINLSFVQPNVRVDVTSGGAPVDGAFVIFSRQVNGQSESVQLVTGSNGAVNAKLPDDMWQILVVVVSPDGSTTTRTSSVQVDQTTSVANPIVITL
jgi:hypothetical protein